MCAGDLFIAIPPFSWPLIKKLVTKRVVKAITDQMASRMVMREGAYVLARFLRFMSLEQRPSQKLFAFVYTNFELFERWTADIKLDVLPVRTAAAHIANLCDFLFLV
jgi:hypothetical protein